MPWSKKNCFASWESGTRPRYEHIQNRISRDTTMSIFNWGKRILQRSRAYLGNRPHLHDDLSPLRAELFGADQMEQFGKALAGMHSLSKYRTRDDLLARLDENEQVLISGCGLLTEAVKSHSRVAPAGEWLLDNFYMIEEQIRTARRHLPKGFARELPRLAAGPSAGLPRVYDLALASIAHGDGRIDGEVLSRFVAAYQTVTPLTLGELWAIPIMLRLALIENLRRVSLRITTARAYVNEAQHWASLMIEVAGTDPKSLILVIADMARSRPPMVSSFIAELVRRLQGHGPALAMPLTWIEQRLAEESLTIEQLVSAENQQQAVDQVSVSNTIGSLRFLGAYDWRVFVENMSIVEHVLREDPLDVYRRMDFASRDEYRRVIDRLAKHSSASEGEVARLAVNLARDNASSAAEGASQAHVGYYLVDRGLPELEKRIAAHVPFGLQVGRWCGHAPLSLYLLGIIGLVLAATAGLLLLAKNAGFSDAHRVLIAVLSLIAATPLATALVNWLITLFVLPKRLPRMDFSLGLPTDVATLVVVPTLLNTSPGVDQLLEALEVRFLGNRDPNLFFGLLTDFGDAAAESLPDDEQLLARAQQGIEQLNIKYATGVDAVNGDRFFLFHRPRQWNEVAGCWMGVERKRGKLADLNGLLRGKGQEAFSLIAGAVDGLPTIRYIITLDSDTQLPRDAARQFVGTMAHPLNRPVYDPQRRRVTQGYGILQPRLAASLSEANRSRYVQLYGNEPGIDPYTRAASDVYQDVFREGSFIGKGIYDLDAFESVLRGCFPPNRILSHDLLEGCYARAGLLSDVHLYEDYPARYAADVSRRERWIRGDWQIARWLLPRVPGADGRALPNPLSALSRWKIADNLLRSLAPSALLLLLLTGWLMATPWYWTLGLLGIIVLPPLLATLIDALRKPNEVFLSQHLATVASSACRNLAQVLFRISCLPHEAVYSLAAILRSCWRLCFAPRLLLEWSASAEQELRSDSGFLPSLRLVWSAPFFAVVAVVGIVLLNPGALLLAVPVLSLWLVAPVLVWWLSRPLERRVTRLSAEQILFLRKIARKTWAFFERFVVAGDNWLPPDNYQESPGPVVAHRTSPTNIGLALLGNLSAYDFGFISAQTLLERTTDTFDTLARMERHRGHFFNWYDTQTLRPLPPRAIARWPARLA
jgi:cyclic beta-1,2-glucan synthetase